MRREVERHLLQGAVALGCLSPFWFGLRGMIEGPAMLQPYLDAVEGALKASRATTQPAGLAYEVAKDAYAFTRATGGDATAAKTASAVCTSGWLSVSKRVTQPSSASMPIRSAR